MVVHRFPLSSGVGEPTGCAGSSPLPDHVVVMHVGEQVCEAQLEQNAYVCDLPEEYAVKLNSGRLDHLFVFEPPIAEGDVSPEVERELVSILLVAARKANSLKA